MKYDTLHELATNAPHTPAHRARLRQALMNTPVAKQSIVTRSLRRLTTLQGVYSMKKSLIAGGSFAVLAFAIGAVSLFSPLNPHVAAMQTTRTSMEAVSQLSAAELATLKSTVAADPQALLREASEAADLTKITRAEFDALAKPGVVMQYGDSNGNTSGKVEGKTGNVAGTGTVDTSSVPTTPTVNGDSTKAGGGASTGTVSSAAIDSRIDSARTFVKFTNAAGKLAVIAFDAHDTPVYTATF